MKDFKWKFKHFKKAIGNNHLNKMLTNDDMLVKSDMEMMHGGEYWPTSDGGLIRLPVNSKKFIFKEWLS